MSIDVGDRPAQAPRRVLVVDDDDLLREVAQASLELVGGWKVAAAHSGAEAQQRAVDWRPDAILLDVMMPGMDGPATVEALSADVRTRDIPVIFLTAKVSDENAAELQSLGVVGVIAKPFDPMTLAADLAGLLGWSM